MAWWNKGVSLGNFPDLAGAVNKLQESVKNIEKNFDSALGFEEKEKSDSSDEASGSRAFSTDKRTLFDPVVALMGHKNEEITSESAQKPEFSEQSPEVAQSSSKHDSPEHSSAVDEKEEVRTDNSSHMAAEQAAAGEGNKVLSVENTDEPPDVAKKENAESSHPGKVEFVPLSIPAQSPEPTAGNVESSDLTDSTEKKDILEVVLSGNLERAQVKSEVTEVDQVGDRTHWLDESHNFSNLHEESNEQKAQEATHEQKMQEVTHEQKTQEEVIHEQKMQEDVTHEQKVQEDVTHEQKVSLVQTQESTDSNAGAATEHTGLPTSTTEETDNHEESLKNYSASFLPFSEASEAVHGLAFNENDGIKVVVAGENIRDTEADIRDQHRTSGKNISDTSSASLELEKVKLEMKMMETALQGAARQAQAKADEIAKLMNENEQLKETIEDLKRKSSDAEIESLREEYHQRVSTLERKVYALTKERDTLRREQSKKSDAAALLKEKDEIITQVMAEGEELSKKQAAQEGQIRKLRAQIREFEEEKKGLTAKLQLEENKVESIKKDKMATEKLLQETIEKHQAELGAQKEYYTNALNVAKEAEAIAEARANNEARSELESRLREAEIRESMLVQALEELRQTLSRKEQQAVFREDMLHRDIEDLQKRYQASERRCEELITQVPESTRPLLRQIEAMQETISKRAEAWAAVERSLNSRLQEAEGKAASAEERERSMNERLTQTLSRINVLEAQISCLRAEQTQLTKSLEKERQRAAENRQEYLAAKEEADTQEGRANQLEEEIRELRRKHKQELQDALMQRELLQQEIEKEKSVRLDLERKVRVNSAVASEQAPMMRQNSAFENGKLSRKLSSASSIGSMEESYFLQASLDSSDNLSERRNLVEATMSPYYMKSMTPSTFEAALRQKEGELASYMSRLASMESIRDSLAEELVKMTEQCEKLRVEAATLPGIRAELEALRRRHSAALELMGERDEELEELRADIIDMKEMYREQVNLLVNKIQIMSSSIGNSEVEHEI